MVLVFVGLGWVWVDGVASGHRIKLTNILLLKRILLDRITTTIWILLTLTFLLDLPQSRFLPYPQLRIHNLSRNSSHHILLILLLLLFFLTWLMALMWFTWVMFCRFLGGSYCVVDLVELAEELFYVVFVGGCVFHYVRFFSLLYFFTKGVEIIIKYLTLNLIKISNDFIQYF